MTFTLTFWARRSDYDEDHEIEFNFTFIVMSEARRVESDPVTAYAPWWDAKIIATVEAESEQVAWVVVGECLEVVERVSAESGAHRSEYARERR